MRLLEKTARDYATSTLTATHSTELNEYHRALIHKAHADGLEAGIEMSADKLRGRQVKSLYDILAVGHVLSLLDEVAE